MDTNRTDVDPYAPTLVAIDPNSIPKQERAVCEEADRKVPNSLRKKFSTMVYAALTLATLAATAQCSKKTDESSASSNETEITECEPKSINLPTATIDSPEKLKEMLDILGIKITAEDFEKFDGKKQRHFQTQIVNGSIENPVPLNYNGEANEDGECPEDEKLIINKTPLSSSGTHFAKDQKFIVVTFAQKEQFAPMIKYVDKSHKATTSYTDESDPRIKYHMYDCAKDNAPRLGTIALIDHKGKKLRLFKMMVQRCTDEKTEE